MIDEIADMIDEVVAPLISKYPHHQAIKAKEYTLVPIGRGQKVQSGFWKDGWDGIAWLSKLKFQRQRLRVDRVEASTEGKLDVASISRGQAIEIGANQIRVDDGSHHWVERWDENSQRNISVLWHECPAQRHQTIKFYVVIARSRRVLILREFRTAKAAARGRVKATYQHLDEALRKIFSAYGMSLAEA